MRISDWSSDVCSSDLHAQAKPGAGRAPAKAREGAPNIIFIMTDDQSQDALGIYGNKILKTPNMGRIGNEGIRFDKGFVTTSVCARSEEHTSELQSLMRISYAVFCLKKTKNHL